ncbi:src-like-adapter 2 isoform X5 [Struthio camelus]|uniref:src-like-adapter 2 isoform X5 n=1 Tax=Struthio camelus TaxID=8801 RepID=UPI00360421C4
MGSLPSREKQLSAPQAAAGPMQPPAPGQAAPSSFLALAVCDFPSGGEAVPVLRMGEQLRVLSEDGEWWLVASVASGQECHIPSSCVAKVWHRWLYEGISREKAEELLLRPCNHSGSFLIRASQTRKGHRQPSRLSSCPIGVLKARAGSGSLGYAAMPGSPPQQHPCGWAVGLICHRLHLAWQQPALRSGFLSTRCSPFHAEPSSSTAGPQKKKKKKKFPAAFG